MSEKTALGKAFLDAKRRLFDKFYGARLNPRQCEAIFTADGPLLVLAGAGSGKTTVLVNRIAYLIKYGDAYFTDNIPDGVDEYTVEALNMALEMDVDEIEQILPQFIYRPCPPWAVLAITFTNKAAKEIKDRLLSTFGDKETSEAVWAGTFHSICLRILRKYADRLGYKDGFSIYDTDDQKRLILQSMKELNVEEKELGVRAVANSISRAKDELKAPEEFECGRDPRDRKIAAIYALYNKRLKEYNAMDFDDIIFNTVKLLSENEDILSYYQKKFRYVLVDEYQDTNHAQFVLTKLISDGYRNIMVVGDDDQSIYRFRGATIENILDFDKTYPDAKVVKLEQNYRSTGNILRLANEVISENHQRHQKRLWSDKGEGDRIKIKEAFDQNDEGKYIVDKITGAVFTEKRKYSDFAVLYRLNALGRTLQTAFTRSGIPFKVVGDMGFYEHKEVKDMLAYLAVICSAEDNLRLKRIINEPKRKIGAATVDAVEQIANGSGLSMFTVIERVDEYPVLSKSKEKLSDFAALINRFKNMEALPSALIEAVFEESGYKAMLEAEGFEGQGRIENVNELIAAAMEYEQRLSGTDSVPTVSGLLEEISLVSSVDKYDDEADAVVLMTVHAAKGLEFPVVFLAGMENGIFPNDSARYDPEEMSEERRLAYVAITRAKEKLFISYAKQRLMYGRSTSGMLSCFIKGVDAPGILERDIPKREPPKQSIYSRPEYNRGAEVTRRSYTELDRRPDMLSEQKKKSAASFGVEKFPKGTVVEHATFGRGAILSAKDLGGDVLYEVRFDGGVEKKLMATYAKLVKL